MHFEATLESVARWECVFHFGLDQLPMLRVALPDRYQLLGLELHEECLP
jgi:hypothetical protein